MPSTRMVPPSPNHASRKALSLFLCSSALTSSSLLTNAGFSTGDRLIMDALSLFPFCFFLLLLMLGLPEGKGEEEEGPNPCARAVGFLGEEVGSASTVGFWDLIENLGFGKMEWW